ncbi:hypothetical protein BDM02DRAFT_3102873 [Thelephora ganbajun]|uniref:Uncharacterized protein n=1 Tax=Thelephora ganbajun TaxID=370292 RepID=A0ACB6Z4H7_THEGA|nr:hypothetical protein BDM02DRAFT_3102873 [Thelephora ganbajun]
MSHTRSSPRSTRPKQANPAPGVSLSLEHIAEAQQKSTDNGATLDLSYKNIRQISEEVAQELVAFGRSNSKEDDSSSVSRYVLFDSTYVFLASASYRLALGFNRLTSLPTAFSLLTHVRYLNLKGNAFTSVPDPVTAMPALEVLDLSRNRIRSFPEQPGSLSNLRVFSLSKNKITVLPAYITQFQSLRIFKVDQNPFEYPPMSVMDPKGDLKDQKFMESWIESVKQWFKTDSKLTRRSSVDSTASEQKSPIVQSSVSFLTADDNLLLFDSATHSRTTSVDSDTSTYSSIEASLRMSFLPTNGLATKSPKAERPPRLNLSPVPSFIPTVTHTDSPTSPSNYLPTPDNSVSSEEDTAKMFGTSQPQHVRNASYAAGSKPSRPSLTAKKSLPDMRLAMPKSAIVTPALPRSAEVPSRVMTESPRNLTSRSSSRQDSGFSEGRSESVRTSTDTIIMTSAIADRPPSVTPIDVERNSYFRRLSTLPSSTICKSIPRSLLTLVDAARGILFAVSQVYQTLQHYTIYAIDERLSAVLLKVLDPASNYMSSLINALDRFDAASRRSIPSPTVCRAVVESCRDTVSVFGKAMGVLTLQLKVLATRDDIRYTRQLLLELYGATAEISNSWQSILPHMEEIEPLLKERPPPSSSKLPQNQVSSTSRSQVSPYIPFASPASHPPSSFVPPPRSILRSYSAQSPGEESERTRMMRRHAGSFSSKDVEIGKMLPSYVEPLPVTPRLPSRNAQNLSISSNISGYRRSWGEHSRQNSQSSLVASSSSSTASSPSIPSRHPTHDPPSSSSTLLDNEAIDAMKVAVDIAPSIWESMETLVGDVVSAKFNIPEALINAKALTGRLSDNIRAVRESDPTADRKALRDDATAFAKTVILLCNVFRNQGTERPLPTDLRANMILLMNATEESVMLLHVSSFSPSNSRPYSPLVSAGSGLGLSHSGLGASLSPSLTTGGPGEDMRDFKIGSGVTATKNALQSNNARPGLYNVSRAQAPYQGFKVPQFTRLDSKGRYGGLTSGDES